MSRGRRFAAACLASVVLAGTLPGVAWAGSHGGHSTRARLRHQRHHAAQLDARAAHQAALVRRSRVALARLDAQANAALSALQTARDAAARAQAASDAAQARLATARARTDAARAAIQQMTANAYQAEDAGGGVASALSLVQSGDPEQFVEGLQVLGQVAKSQQAVIDDLRVAEALQLRSEHVAAAAAATAVATERGATIAKQHADMLVAEQRHALARQHRLLAHTRLAAGRAHARVRALQHRIDAARARAAAIRAAEARAAGRAGAIAQCNGGSVAGYANGRLPVSALCPLWGAPGMMLQAAAAAAFNRMSHAYAGAFGSPLCVTSSYRTYAKQVELYATMPAGYAAVPGTSNHGWGLAVDLCGGIQVDGSPESNWLLDHAAAYDWFHPAWAMPGGAGPHEPWHWEYAG